MLHDTSILDLQHHCFLPIIIQRYLLPEVSALLFQKTREVLLQLSFLRFSFTVLKLQFSFSQFKTRRTGAVDTCVIV